MDLVQLDTFREVELVATGHKPYPFPNTWICIILSSMVIDLISQVSLSKEVARILVNILSHIGLDSCNLWGESSMELMPMDHQLIITIIFPL